MNPGITKHISSKKDLSIKEEGVEYKCRNFSSQKIKRKPKLRNLNPNTYEINKINETQEFKGSRFERLKSELGKTHKVLNIEKSISENAHTRESTDKQTEKPQNQKVFRKSQPIRAATLIISAENEFMKEQEQKLEWRKKATEKYNSISANFKITAQNQAYKYIIMKGNNSNIIKK